MLKSLAVTVAAGAMSALFVISANALPLAQSKDTAATDEIVFVREGCGPGMQYSNRLRRCVVDTPRAMIRDAMKPDRCGRGWRWSDRFRRCVRN